MIDWRLKDKFYRNWNWINYNLYSWNKTYFNLVKKDSNQLNFAVYFNGNSNTSKLNYYLN